ncbi:MinD/ParA family protein [Sinimarinibacterium flocculans]|uniref:Flagellar biosynthesis protein FlhG n=1 Tax=Sinimarinibacterium flocculans TaxID=985250 RepID=A0A318E9E3_9GAMM|nr:MinD/ParA family protein [Sinimarinibacterium flocculans]MEC9362410.1 MinD/ParA family protein [Pseudomonadota bacterium]PXV66070.1 flagellar biosynthesis protein FlhG [Sinimarinibacterium flocculans]
MPASDSLFGHQASGLAALRMQRPVQVIAVTSGKGGVGKTSTSVNLAVSMAMDEQRVMLLDGDLGLANIDVMLGLQPQRNLSHVLDGSCSLEDTIIEGPSGVMVVPASSGQRNMAELSAAEHAGLVRAFSDLRRPLDTLIVDTAAGIADSVITFSQASQEIIVVVTNDPQSLTDAYALIKVLSRDHGVRRFQVLSNMTQTPAEAREIFENLRRVSERFLNVTLVDLGTIPGDEWLRRAVRRQRAVVEAYPSAPSARAYRDLARRVRGWTMPEGARGNLEFFVERLIHGGVATGVAA